jgi:hypothetical protein
MVLQHNWYKPTLVRRLRTALSIILWFILLCLLYLNHGWIIKIDKNIF